MEQVKICGKYVFIPKHLLKKRKHREKKDWVAIYYYQKKPVKVSKDQVSTEKVISTKLEYRKNVFYKMCQLSEDDQYFDYYFKLKDNVPDVVLNPTLKRPSRKDSCQDIKFNSDGQVVVEF